MKYILYIACLFVSCNPVKKAIQTMDEHKPAAALYCADRFPVHDSVIVKDSVRYDTTYLPGDSIIFTRPDSIGGISIDTTIPYKKICPPLKIITKTVYHDSLIIRKDIASETALTYSVKQKDLKILELTDAYEEMKGGRGWWRIACLITWGLLGLGLAVKLRKLI